MVSITDNLYDEQNRIVSIRYVYTNSEDGTVYNYLQTYEYNEAGDVVKIVNTSESDDGGTIGISGKDYI